MTCRGPPSDTAAPPGPNTPTDLPKAAQQRLHRALRGVLAEGHADGSIRGGVTLRELSYFGAMLVSPVRGAADWRLDARRQKEIHLAGLAP